MDGSRRRAFVAVGGTVALAIALAACGGTSNNAGSGSSPAAMQPVDLQLMVGGLNKQIYLPNMLAKQLGYFDAEKINITLVDEGSGQGTELEVVAGNVDAGSGAYSHPVELNALGKKIETICQFGIAPGEAEMLVDLRTPATTQAALGGDYPFIGIFAKNDWVNSHKDVAQRLVNVYVKTLKWMKAHTAAEIAAKMPADYLVPSKDLYVAA